MRALSVLLVLAVVWLCWHGLNKALYRDAVSPFNLLFYAWAAPFILSFSDLSTLQTGMGEYSISVALTATLILMATCLLPALLGARTGLAGDAGRVPRIRPLVALAFYGIALLALYFSEFQGRNLPLLAYWLGDMSDPNLHAAGKDSKLQVLAFGIYPAAMFVFYLLLRETRWHLRYTYLLMCLLVLAAGIVKASKSDVYISLLTFGALLYYHYRRQNRQLPRFYSVIAIVALLGVISITSIRLEGVGLREGYASLTGFRYQDLMGGVPSEIVSIAYGYVALGFQNFSNYVGLNNMEFRIGTSFFRPLLSMFMMGDLADTMGVAGDARSAVSGAANTGTFLTPLYIEGGVLFCLLGSLAYGLFVNIIYFAFRRSRSVTWMFVYVSLLFPWTWLFFTNAFSVLSIYVNLFYIAMVSSMFFKTAYRPAPDSPTGVSELPAQAAVPARPKAGAQ